MRSVVKSPVRAGAPVMGPAILVSGYLAKRTRTLGRWKKRWWQLTDDGTLLYFKSEDRTKALGEIDIARSCYDVKFGADQCKVEFPRAVPSCCCFSFSVLKRTYYLYAASPADAKGWAENIASVSVVLNYRKKISHRPAPEPPAQRPVSNPCLSIEEQQQNSEDRGGGIEKRSYSIPGRLPRLHASVSGDITCLPTVSESTEASDKPTELPKIKKPSGKRRAYRMGRGALTSENWYGSAPSLQTGNQPTQSPPHSSAKHNPSNAQLWLDGSPAPNARMGRKIPRQHRNPRQRGQRIFEPRIRQPLSSMHGGSLDKLPVKRQVPIDTGSRRMFTRWPVDMDGYELPPRPQSVDVSLLHTKQSPFSRLHQQHKVNTSVHPKNVLPSLSTEQTSSIDEEGAEHKSFPPPVKPKPILKKTRPASSSIDEEQSIQSVSDADSALLSPPEIPPKRYSMKVSVNSVNGKRNVFLPPPPDFKPPPPPEQSSGNSSPVSMSAIGITHDQNSVSSVTEISTAFQTKSPHYEPQSFNTASEYLQQLSMEIKRVGIQQKDGTVCTTFRQLQRQTEGIFPDFIGTLLLARKYQVVHFAGATLVEGRDDGKLITLCSDKR